MMTTTIGIRLPPSHPLEKPAEYGLRPEVPVLHLDAAEVGYAGVMEKILLWVQSLFG